MKTLIPRNAFLVSLLCALLLPHSALAAISFIGSCENSAINGSDVTLTLPATEVNDLVIVAYSIGDDDAVNHNMAVTSPASTFTEVADLFGDDTEEISMGVYWDITNDSYTTVTVDGLGGSDAAVAAVCMVFRGVDTTTPMDVTPVTGIGTNSMHANPAAINHNNPSGVWTVIVGGSAHLLGGSGTYTFPTGYTTDAIDRGSDETTAGATDTTVGMGYRSSGVSDPEDPGTMTHSGTDNAGSASATTTMALRPATAVAPTITTADVSIGMNNATLFAEITNNGGADATESGFAYSTNSTLSSGVSTTTLGAQTGAASFNQFIAGLSANTTYYYRAYATNTASTGYGTIKNFTTGNTTPTRSIRLFGGQKLKFYNGSVQLYQR